MCRDGTGIFWYLSVERHPLLESMLHILDTFEVSWKNNKNNMFFRDQADST